MPSHDYAMMFISWLLSVSRPSDEPKATPRIIPTPNQPYHTTLNTESLNPEPDWLSFGILNYDLLAACGDQTVKLGSEGEGLGPRV